MKHLFKTGILFGALVLGQQAFAQEGIRVQTLPTAPTARPLPSSLVSPNENRQKNPFYIPRFNVERFVQQLSQQNSGKREMDYFSRNMADSSRRYSELKDFKIDTRPFQLYDSGVSLTLFPRKRNITGSTPFSSMREGSVPTGVVRKIWEWARK